MFNKGIVLGAGLVLALAVGFADNAKATDAEVEASIVTRAAITLVTDTEMDFGDVDYGAGQTGLIRLGTNGAVDLVGTTDLTMAGAPAAGQITITGDGASAVDITCDTGATLTDGGANTLTMINTEIVTNTGVAGGAGTACGGVGVGALAHTLDGTDIILIGGSLDITNDAIDVSGTYDSTAAGGTGVTVRVVYQ